jgi:hypothetical protein
MIRTLCLFVIILAASIPSSPGSAAPTPPPAAVPAETKLDPGVVEQLLRQLGHSDFRQRAAALQRLELYGPEILPLVNEHLRTTEDAEVRRNLVALAAALKQIVAVQPTRINISMKQKTVREVVTEFGKQSGYKMELYPNGGADDERERRVIDIELKNVPFWQALDSICQLGGLTYFEGWYGYENFTVRLHHGESEVNFLHVDGPFRVRVQGFNYYRHIHFPVGQRNQNPNQGGVQRNESLQVNFGIAVEPKLPMLGAGQPVFTHAEDERGQSLLPPQAQMQPNMNYSYSSYRMYMQHVSGTLQPAGNVKKIKLLKGMIPVRLISSQTPRITVENVTAVKNQSFKDGNTTVVVEEAKVNGNNLVLKVSVSEPAQKDIPDYAWSNAVTQRLEIMDEKGVRIRNNGILDWQNNGGTAKGSIQYWIENPVQGGLFGDKVKYKLVYSDWTTVNVGVPFEFRDLPLP